MGCRKCLAITALIIGVAAFYLAPLFMTPDLPPLELKDDWWGSKSADVKEEGKPRKFEVSVKPSEIDDLKRRLRSARYATPLDDVNFEYGMNTKYLKKVLDYWLNKYDWPKEQARINSFPQYKMQIEGLKVHYVHVKPKATGKRVLPLMLVHGWPGSVLEFYNAIPLLTEPKPGRDFVFEVICPHIPGYGFSDAPRKTGFNQAQAAKIFHKLMKNLGHQQYYIQGGDWGSIITTVMAILKPDNVLGLHLNALPISTVPLDVARWIIGSYIPQLAPTKDVVTHDKLYPISRGMGLFLAESGYMHIQGTKPDTVGVSLSDSPAGLAAYILEKFGGWTENDKSLAAQDGAIFDYFSQDELLTNVMVYWLNNAITSSARFYKEFMSAKFYELQITKRKVKPVSGLLICDTEPFDIAPPGVDLHVDLIHVDTAACGHFAAMQNPVGFANSVLEFVDKAELQRRSQKKEV